MLIALGSTNPSKLEAVRLGFESYFTDQKCAVIGTAAVSGVSDQPMSMRECLFGARNRAADALRLAPEAQFGVGIEGGLEQVDEYFFANACIVVIDREGKEGIGYSVGMPLPQEMAQLVLEGHELGAATDVYYNGTNTKHAEGFFGRLTENRITRSMGYRDAVIVALSHLKTQSVKVLVH